MKKPLLNSSLKAYSALAGSFLAAGNVVEASVVYTNINDVTKTQTTLGISSYDIDLNNDGTTDYKIGVFKANTTQPVTASSTGVAIYPQGTNLVAVDVNTYASALVAGNNINSSLLFNDGSTSGTAIKSLGLAVTTTTTGTSSYGNFINTTNKFIGVKFTSGANTFFGWIRVDVGNFNTFTVKDFAFENTPNTAILAGQGIPSGVQNSYLENITTLKNINNVLELEFTKPMEGTVEVMNISGTVVKSATLSGTSGQVNLLAIPAGIYNVVISVKEGVLVKKIFVQ